MAETKLVVIYPYPTDVDAFEKAYVDEHVPLAKEKIRGMTKFVATKAVGTPDGQKPPFYRIAECTSHQWRRCSDRPRQQEHKKLPLMPSRSQREALQFFWWQKKKQRPSSEVQLPGNVGAVLPLAYRIA
jgi:uncharacterized protein (TIGR02118 family)